MKKLLAGVTALVTVCATGCFGIGTSSADDTPIGGPTTPGAPGDQTAYALGGAHVLGIPYDEYIRREGAEWFPGQQRQIVRYPAGQVQGHVLERLFPGIGKLDELFPGLGMNGPSVGESVDEGIGNLDAAIRTTGRRIHTFAADIGDESQVDELLGRIRAELPPLAGVAHLAGVLDDALLSQQSLERFRTTLAPKAFGAYHLDRLTKKDDLDFFIVSSSVSSLFGSPGQANYATANALLDGLVAERKAQGLPATGVNFGPWAQGGMASSEAARANLSAQGLIPLEPSAALSALAAVVANGTGQATVIKANWQRAAKLLGASRPPILDLVLPSAVGEVTGDSELLRQLQEIPEAQRAGFVTEFLQREVQNFLRLAQPPAASSRFLDLGTDSLMAVELRNRLHSQFGGAFTINATAVFDYPTIGGLAEYLVGQLPESESESVPESATESGEAESVAAPEPSQSGEAESVAVPEPS
jgi:acyl carrier protein